MRLLLDTHVFLWWVADAPQLTRKARRAISAKESECFVSLASCWEMAIKLSLGKLALTQPLEPFVSEQLAINRFRLLPIEFRHVVAVTTLPFHHRDPFDRLLIAQAVVDDLTLVTTDQAFKKYDCTRIS